MPHKCIESGTPYQALIYNRGGNRNFGALSEYQAAALCYGTNRVVLATQYRGAGGSTGEDEFGGADVNDVLKLIDLCEQFELHPLFCFLILVFKR